MTDSLKEIVEDRIAGLERELTHNSEPWRASNVYVGIVNLATLLYGKGSPALEAIQGILQHLTPPTRNPARTEFGEFYRHLIENFRGVLHTMKSDVDAGLVGSLEARLQGEVFADFITTAKAALDGGEKDVAAVLACAAFEDSIKRYADHVGIAPSEEGLQATINHLKAKGLLGGAQKGIVDSFVRVRNAAMHADWQKIHAEDVRGVIGFVEQFLLTRFEVAI